MHKRLHYTFLRWFKLLICLDEISIYDIWFSLIKIMRLVSNRINWFWQICLTWFCSIKLSCQIIQKKKTVQNKLPNVICWKECNVQSHKGIICSETLLEAKKEVEILLIIYVISLSLEEVVCLKFSLLHTLVVSTMYTSITYTSSYIYHR